MLGDCSVEALTVGLSCGIEDVEAVDDALRDDVLAAASASPFGGGAAGETVRVGAGSPAVGLSVTVLEASP